MSRMMGKNTKSLRDYPASYWYFMCGGPYMKGRAQEKREWMKEVENEGQDEQLIGRVDEEIPSKKGQEEVVQGEDRGQTRVRGHHQPLPRELRER